MKTVVVTGDPSIDWFTRRAPIGESTGCNWQLKPYAARTEEHGGCCLLAKMLETAMRSRHDWKVQGPESLVHGGLVEGPLHGQLELLQCCLQQEGK